MVNSPVQISMCLSLTWTVLSAGTRAGGLDAPLFAPYIH